MPRKLQLVALALAALLLSPLPAMAQSVTLYMVDAGTDALYTVNTGTGEATQVGSAPAGFGVGETRPRGLAAVGNTLYMVGQQTDALYTVNTSTGLATRVGSATAFDVLAGRRSAEGLAAIGNTLYMLGSGGGALYTVNTSTGVAEQVGSASSFGLTPPEISPRGLAAIGNTLYMLGDRNRALYTVDTSTGVATRVGRARSFGVGESSPFDLAAIGNTLYMIGSRNDALYTVDTSTGVAEQVGNATQFGANLIFPTGLAFFPQLPPEVAAAHERIIAAEAAELVTVQMADAADADLATLRPLLATAVTSSLTAQTQLDANNDELNRLNDAITTAINTGINTGLRTQMMQLVDLSGDTNFNQNDFLLHYYATTMQQLLGNGTNGGSPIWRRSLLGAHANGGASDADLMALLARARELRAIAPPLTAAQLSNLGNVDSGGVLQVGIGLGNINRAWGIGFNTAELFVLREVTFRVRDLRGSAANRGALQVTVHAAADGAPTLPATTALATLTGASTATGDTTYTAPEGLRLPEGGYFVVWEAPAISAGRTSFDLNHTRNGDEDAGAPAGWSISNNSVFRDGASGNWGVFGFANTAAAVRLTGGTPVP